MPSNITDLEILEKYPEVWKYCNYQHKTERDPTDSERVNSVLENLNFFKGTKVLLDIGCWEGLYSHVASRYCDKVVGIEPDPKHYKQAQELSSFFEQKMRGYYFPERVDVHKIAFEAYDFNYEKAIVPDSIIACNITHHMNDNEIKWFEFMAKYVDKIVMQIRPGFFNVQNKYQLHEIEPVVKMLAEPSLLLSNKKTFGGTVTGKTVKVKKINQHRVLIKAHREYPERLDLRDYSCLLNRLVNDKKRNPWLFDTVKLLQIAVLKDNFNDCREPAILTTMDELPEWKERSFKDQVFLSTLLANVTKSIDEKGYDIKYANPEESHNAMYKLKEITFRKTKDGFYSLLDGARRLSYLYVTNRPMPVRIIN